MTNVREMIDRLVGFDTVSRNSNLPLIGYVQDYLFGYGIESQLVPNAEGDKANLYATVGPMVADGIVLSAHTDVVPVDGQDWSSDPFKVTEKNGRLYGRGTCDMKGFAAIALALVPDMVKAGLKRPIHLALSYDEELACLGAPDMIREMRRNLPPARAVIVGEPTSMEVVTAHKGFLGLTTRVTGFEVHSSLMHTGVSAVAEAARLIAWLDDVARANMAAADPGDPFVPPFSTLNCGLIKGGTAQNITAKTCSFTTDIRTIPSENTADYHARYLEKVAEAKGRMKSVNAQAGISVEVFADVPGLRPETEGEAERLARAITGDNGTHVVSYGTEAGQFQDEGFSTVVCGPGSIEQAHQPNEYVSLAQIEAGTRFIREIIDREAA